MRRSPLHDAHLAAGAKLVDFGGWEMPLSYPAGTLHEHWCCRRAAAVFDVSHLGTLRVEGPSAFDRLQWALTNDLGRIEPGRAQYSHLLDPDDASVLDDVIVWWKGPERFDVMPNASNTGRVHAAIDAAGVDAADTTSERALVALAGPTARSVLGAVCPDAASVGRFCVVETSWQGLPVVVAGTGYTGEDGVEMAVAADGATALWDALVAAGAEPAGLGARDTLRLEAGLPLYGNELGPGITPLQAGLGWVVRWDKGDFRGREALAAERATGPHRVLTGLRAQGRRPPRAGQRVLAGGQVVGEVTSGNFSPVLGCGIALAFCPPHTAEGDHLVIEGRGGELAATVVRLPFVSPGG